jgi:thiamine kinase
LRSKAWFVLEQQLHRWRSWDLPQRPVIERKLGLGRTNRNYLMSVAGRELVLRINHGASASMGINRQREQQILSLVSAAGIAPQVYYNNPDEGILITEYLRGEHWPGDEAIDSLRQQHLLELMQRIHELALPLPRFDYMQQAEAYWQALPGQPLQSEAALVQERQRMLPLLRQFQQNCQCHSLCHHDPVLANIIDANGRLYMIDWEYAGMGCRAFDYAALSAETGLSPQIVQSTDVSCDLGLAAEVYTYLCSLWLLLRSPNDAPAA